MGADTIAMGSILDIHRTGNQFSGYGIDTTNEVVACSIRIRIIDRPTGEVLFSKTVDGRAQGKFSSRYGQISAANDPVNFAIRNAVDRLRGDVELYGLFR